MAERRGKEVDDGPVEDRPLPGSQLARVRLRQQWEFASVLNFLHVFRPLIPTDLKFSAEEIETALITPNDDLAQLHIALLKGIPPVIRNMSADDAWISVVCKKLATWWPWVAEGENPLKIDQGKEILRYKELDLTSRVLILKALCEVRAIQDDVLRYISDELKKGTLVTNFRKERIGSDGNGITYWYDGDPVLGHRLYKEIVIVEHKQKPKGKGRVTEPTISSKWQTLATDLEEFREISDTLSSSKTKTEAAVGKVINADVVPVLEELQKKKERALKRQQRQGQQLNGFLSSNGFGITRSRRERRPVCYTFDDFDRSIDEALQTCKTSETTGRQKDKKEQVSGEKANSSDQVNSSQGEDSESPMEVEGNDDCQSNEDNEDYDYEEKDDDDDDDEGKGEDEIEHEDSGDSNEEEMCHPPPKRTDSKLKRQKNLESKAIVGLRRSRRFLEPNNDHAETKRRLRQRSTRNIANVAIISSDSEDNSSDNEKETETVSDTETDASAGTKDNQKETEMVSDTETDASAGTKDSEKETENDTGDSAGTNDGLEVDSSDADDE